MTEEEIKAMALQLVEDLLNADDRFININKVRLALDYETAITGILENERYNQKWQRFIDTYTNGCVIYYLTNGNGKFTSRIQVNEITEPIERRHTFSILNTHF